jgi:hypothetical protein
MRTIALALVLLATTATGVFGVSGSATFTGRSTLAAAHCGSGHRSFTADVQVHGDGTWSAQGSIAASGTYAAVGRSGRKFLLDFDDPSRATFFAVLEADTSALCRLPVTVTGGTRKAFAVVLNRKATRVTLTVRYRITGTAAGNRGHATFQVHAKGPWTPG